jgi:hypothetical protein
MVAPPVRDLNDPFDLLLPRIPEGAAFPATFAGPFARAVRRHPRRGSLNGWHGATAVPWLAADAAFTHAPDIDPATRLDYHTGVSYPQDPASQVPVALLAPQSGEVVLDLCAAPGSKSSQIGLALGDAGLLVCADLSAPRRGVLTEVLARQGVSNAIVTPLAPERLVDHFAGAADAVLVDAPCSGHERRSAKQVARMAERQLALLTLAAKALRAGGRLVYSTCTPYEAENEGVIAAFLAAHPEFRVTPTPLPGCDPDLAGFGGVRLYPHRQGSEPFFAVRLEHQGDQGGHQRGDQRGWLGRLPPGLRMAAADLDPRLLALTTGSEPLHLWSAGRAILAATPEAASAAIPSEARGILCGHVDDHGAFRWTPWGLMAALDRAADTRGGHQAQVVDHALACALWAGTATVAGATEGNWVRTASGAPLGELDGRGALRLPSRLRRAVV